MARGVDGVEWMSDCVTDSDCEIWSGAPQDKYILIDHDDEDGDDDLNCEDHDHDVMDDDVMDDLVIVGILRLRLLYLWSKRVFLMSAGLAAMEARMVEGLLAADEGIHVFPQGPASMQHTGKRSPTGAASAPMLCVEPGRNRLWYVDSNPQVKSWMWTSPPAWRSSSKS